MISHRTRYSLAQFLSIQEASVSIALFSKYGVEHLALYPAQLLPSIVNTVRDQDDRTLLKVLQEIVATPGNLRAKVSPKTLFEERMHDLTQCLLIDGYIAQDKKLLQTDPSIADAAPVEDDLITALRGFGSPQRDAIIDKINDSAEAFRAAPPDYNAALTNRTRRARSALGGCRSRSCPPAADKRLLQPRQMGRGHWLLAKQRRDHARRGKKAWLASLVSSALALTGRSVFPKTRWPVWGDRSHSICAGSCCRIELLAAAADLASRRLRRRVVRERFHAPSRRHNAIARHPRCLLPHPQARDMLAPMNNIVRVRQHAAISLREALSG
ncbi:hypothetical protein N5K55_21690 [Pseudomonas aeruginosa]|nr:hypothetical protein [Pseudomonas aeruginosa]